MCHVAAAQRLILARLGVAHRQARRVLDYEVTAFSDIHPPRPGESARAHIGSPTYGYFADAVLYWLQIANQLGRALGSAPRPRPCSTQAAQLREKFPLTLAS